MKVANLFFSTMCLAMIACSNQSDQACPTPPQNPEPARVAVDDGAPAANPMNLAVFQESSLATDALRGDPGAAWQLYVEYGVGQNRQDLADPWARIAAENGSLDGAVVVARLYLDAGASVHNCERSKFWILKAYSYGYRRTPGNPTDGGFLKIWDERCPPVGVQAEWPDTR